MIITLCPLSLPTMKKREKSDLTNFWFHLAPFDKTFILQM